MSQESVNSSKAVTHLATKVAYEVLKSLADINQIL